MSNPSLGYYWVLTDNMENSLRDNYSVHRFSVEECFLVTFLLNICARRPMLSAIRRSQKSLESYPTLPNRRNSRILSSHITNRTHVGK